MRKIFLGILIGITVLVISGAATANPNQIANKAKEPLDKITFIHYKDGTIKGGGGAAMAPTCYKLLGIKWRTLPVSYVINPNGYNTTFVTDAISASIAEWDSHTSATLFNGYTVDRSATWDDIAVNVDYKNEYVFGTYSEPNVIAVTNIWYTRYAKQIVDYDVLFNTKFAWGDATKSGSSVMDLQSIATHETGHGIGLADIYSNSCSTVTMYGYSTEGETTKKTLEAADITGLRKLYGI